MPRYQISVDAEHRVEHDGAALHVGDQLVLDEARPDDKVTVVNVADVPGNDGLVAVQATRV